MPTPTGWKAAVDWQTSPAVKATFGATMVPTPGMLLASDTVAPGKPARSVPAETVANVAGSSCAAHTPSGVSADSVVVEMVAIVKMKPEGTSVTVPGAAGVYLFVASVAVIGTPPLACRAWTKKFADDWPSASGNVMLFVPTAVSLVDRSTRLSSALVTVMLTPPAGAGTSRLTPPLLCRFLPSD